MRPPDRRRWSRARPEDRAWNVAAEGYAVRSVGHGRAEGAVLEVVRAGSRAVLASEFQPPAGFRRESFKASMGGGQ